MPIVPRVTLNKEICKRCINNAKTVKWTEGDDQLWEAGRVLCPRAEEIVENGKVKKWKEKCPYVLEHVISNDNKSK